MLVVLHAEVRCICEEAPKQCEPPRVAALLLERQRRAAERFLLRDGGRVVAAVNAQELRHSASEHGARAVTRGLGALGNRIGCLGSSAANKIHHVPHSLELECEVEPEWA